MTKHPKPGQKTYVDDKDAAINLAISVSDLVEEKTQRLIQKHHAKASIKVAPEDQGNKPISKAKIRMDRAKAVIIAKSAAAKKEKARLRKQKKQGDMQDSRNHATASGPRLEPVDSNGSKHKKRVTFG